MGRQATPANTCELIMGSGATSFEWYHGHGAMYLYELGSSTPRDDWSVTLLMEDPEDSDDSLAVTVNHEAVMQTAQWVVDNQRYRRVQKFTGSYEAWSETLERQCRNLLDDAGEADFDAASADELLQLLAYDHVVVFA